MSATVSYEIPRFQEILKEVLGAAPEGTYAGRFVFDRRYGSDPRNIRYGLENLLDQVWHKAIRPSLTSPLFLRTKLECYPSDFDRFEIRVKTQISPVQEIPVVYKLVSSLDAIPADLYYCSWCGGHTHNDKRGHCCACGGPRTDKTFEESGR